MTYTQGDVGGAVLQHFLNPPNWFTAASIFCSTYALTLIVGGEPSQASFVRACVFVVFAGIFDNLDGRVARLTKRGSAFGTQLDSIADVVGFGIAPAMLAWSWKLHELGTLGVGLTAWYVVCAAFRLARYNVAAETGSWVLRGHTQGLTTTMAGGILVSAAWVGHASMADVAVRPGALAVLVAVLGYLMVSSIPFRNFKDVRSNPKARAILLLSVAAIGTSAVALDPSLVFGVGSVLYLVGGLLDGLVTAAYHRRLAHALQVTDENDDDLWES